MTFDYLTEDTPSLQLKDGTPGYLDVSYIISIKSQSAVVLSLYIPSLHEILLVALYQLDLGRLATWKLP